MVDSYAGLVAESLSAIAIEAPTAYATTSKHAAGMTFVVTIDDEPISLIADPLLRVGAPTLSPQVTARTSAAAIAAILDGHTTVERLILQDRLEVHGSLDDLARAHDVLLGFVHGAIRAPAVPKLRLRFEALAGLRP